jgi:hypothetical protein
MAILQNRLPTGRNLMVIEKLAHPALNIENFT